MFLALLKPIASLSNLIGLPKLFNFASGFFTKPMTSHGRNIWTVIIFALVVGGVGLMNYQKNHQIYQLTQQNQIFAQQNAEYNERLLTQTVRLEEAIAENRKLNIEIRQAQEKATEYYQELIRLSTLQYRSQSAVSELKSYVKNLLANPERYGCLHQPIPPELVKRINQIGGAN